MRVKYYPRLLATAHSLTLAGVVLAKGQMLLALSALGEIPAGGRERLLKMQQTL